MIENVVSLKMPVNETLVIKKNRLSPEITDKRTKRISIVTGTHGDELDGQYICYEIVRRINEHKEFLTGIVDVYPYINPLGIESCSRGIPTFDLDMNRVFPGIKNGSLAEIIAYETVQDIIGSDMCVDVHSSNVYIKEIPQVRITDDCADSLLPYAKLLNADIVWIKSVDNVLESTLANSLNKLQVPTLVIEMGFASKISKKYGDQTVDGIFNLMSQLGIWTGDTVPVRDSLVSTEHQIKSIHAEESGIFISGFDELGANVTKGTVIGYIVDPLTGIVKQTLESPKDGMLITLREHPVVYKGAIIARVRGGDGNA